MDRKSFVAGGLRWIGSLFNRAAEYFEQPSEYVPYEDFISDVRHRIQSRYY
jgi:hypothetical protein